MLTKWQPDENSRTPLFMQLADYIRQLVRSGALRPNKRLPAEREMAQKAGLSRNTVKLALSQLIIEGLLVTKPQSGTFIAPASWRKATQSKSVDWAQMFRMGRSVLTGAEESGASLGGLLNISARRPDEQDSFLKRFLDSVPFSEFKADKLYADDAKSALGSHSLRLTISDHLKRYNIIARPEEILLTSSTNQTIRILTEAFIGQGVNFYHESAGYLNLRGTVASAGSNNIGLPLDDEGICIDKLKTQALFTKKAIMHIQPSNQHPTGITTSLTRRQEIVKTFCDNRVPVIELDSMQDIWAETPPPPSIKSMDKHNSVIFAGNLAKSTSEDITITWVVADEYVVNNLAVIKMQQDKHVNTFIQAAAEIALRTGFYYDYMDYFRKFLITRRDQYNEIMTKHLADIASWHPTRSSYYIWPEFVKEINTTALLEKSRGVTFFPSSYYGAHDTAHLSICTLAMSAELFEQAIIKLRKAADSVLRKR